VPLTFANESEYDKIDLNDEIEIENIKDAIINNREIMLYNKTKNIKIPLLQDLSQRDRDMLVDGGLLNYTKNRAN
jgi:aconitate hydratase